MKMTMQDMYEEDQSEVADLDYYYEYLEGNLFPHFSDCLCHCPLCACTVWHVGFHRPSICVHAKLIRLILLALLF